jgi:hypothetical protein
MLHKRYPPSSWWIISYAHANSAEDGVVGFKRLSFGGSRTDFMDTVPFV